MQSVLSSEVTSHVGWVYTFESLFSK